MKLLLFFIITGFAVTAAPVLESLTIERMGGGQIKAVLKINENGNVLMNIHSCNFKKLTEDEIYKTGVEFPKVSPDSPKPKFGGPSRDSLKEYNSLVSQNTIIAQKVNNDVFPSEGGTWLSATLKVSDKMSDSDEKVFKDIEVQNPLVVIDGKTSDVIEEFESLAQFFAKNYFKEYCQ